MNTEQRDAMEMRATAQQYTGPSAGRIANLIPQRVSFERGWFWTTTAICHGGASDGLAFRQRPDGNGIDVRCHTGGCTRAHAVTALEGVIGLPIWTAYEPVGEAPAVRLSKPGSWHCTARPMAERLMTSRWCMLPFSAVSRVTLQEVLAVDASPPRVRPQAPDVDVKLRSRERGCARLYLAHSF